MNFRIDESFGRGGFIPGALRREGGGLFGLKRLPRALADVPTPILRNADGNRGIVERIERIHDRLGRLQGDLMFTRLSTEDDADPQFPIRHRHTSPFQNMRRGERAHMTPMSFATFVQVVGGTPVVPGVQDVTVTGVAIDHREVKPGHAFVAFVGSRVNGHQFVDEAFRRGASVAVVTEDVKTALGPCVRVPDALQAVQALARWERDRFSGPVVGITGSTARRRPRRWWHPSSARSARACTRPQTTTTNWAYP